MSKTARVAPKDFVEAWQKSDTIEDVVNALSFKSLTAARSRASNYRKKGIELKFFPSSRGPRPIDVVGLNELAAKFAPKDGSAPARKSKSTKRKSKAKSKKN